MCLAIIFFDARAITIHHRQFMHCFGIGFFLGSGFFIPFFGLFQVFSNAIAIFVSSAYLRHGI